MSRTIASRRIADNQSPRMIVIIHPEGPLASFDRHLLFPELSFNKMQLRMKIWTRIRWTMKVLTGSQTRPILALKMRYRAMELQARVSTSNSLGQRYSHHKALMRVRVRHLINTRPSTTLISCLRNKNKTLSRVKRYEGRESRVRIGLAVVRTSPCQLSLTWTFTEMINWKHPWRISSVCDRVKHRSKITRMARTTRTSTAWAKKPRLQYLYRSNNMSRETSSLYHLSSPESPRPPRPNNFPVLRKKL